MGIGESVSKGFSVAKKSMSVVGVLFVVGSIFSLINVFLAPQTAPGVAATAPATASPVLIAAGIVFIFLSIFIQAGSMGFIRDLIKTGSASLANFTSTGGKYYLRLLLLGIAVSLVIGVFVLLAALSAALLKDGLAVIGIPLAILFGALGIYFVVMMFLSPYAAVVDEQGVVAALKLSMKLVKKNILTLLGIVLVLILIGFGIGLVLGAVVAGLSFVVKQPMAAQVLFALLSSAVNSFLGIVVTGAFMSFYLSLPDRNNT